MKVCAASEKTSISIDHSYLETKTRHTSNFTAVATPILSSPSRGSNNHIHCALNSTNLRRDNRDLPSFSTSSSTPSSTSSASSFSPDLSLSAGDEVALSLSCQVLLLIMLLETLTFIAQVNREEVTAGNNEKTKVDEEVKIEVRRYLTTGRIGELHIEIERLDGPAISTQEDAQKDYTSTLSSLPIQYFDWLPSYLRPFYHTLRITLPDGTPFSPSPGSFTFYMYLFLFILSGITGVRVLYVPLMYIVYIHIFCMFGIHVCSSIESFSFRPVNVIENAASQFELSLDIAVNSTVHIQLTFETMYAFKNMKELLIYFPPAVLFCCVANYMKICISFYNSVFFQLYCLKLYSLLL